MIKKASWGLAAAAAVLLAVFTVIGFPTADRGTEATIGAAQKYQGGQLAAGDVKVGDASVQEFLQSDAFDRLLKDPDARAILSDMRIRTQLASRDFANSLSDMQKRAQLANNDLYRFFSDSAAIRALDLRMGSGLKADAALLKMAQDNALSAATRDLVNRIHADAILVRMLDDNAVRVAFSDNLFRQFTQDAVAMKALTSDAFVAAARQAGFADALKNGAIAQALNR